MRLICVIEELFGWCSNNYKLRTKMSGMSVKQESTLHVKAVTWLKDSHSLFDYEFNKNVNQEKFDLNLTARMVFLYRNSKTSEISISENKILDPPQEDQQLLGAFELKNNNRKHFIEFHHAKEFQEETNAGEEVKSAAESNDGGPSKPRQEDVYLIVRSLKNKHNQNKGYRLKVGHIIKIGRVQYKVNSMKRDSALNEETLPHETNYFSNTSVFETQQLQPTAEDLCKYCLEGQSTESDNFLISPCKCSGTSGMVHLKCLEQWIQSKVKKEVTGGTLHYNFEKFFCQVCKDEFPRYIKKQNELYQLMQIKKPEGSYMILEGISQKSKNLMVIQNIPEDGIKLGRSHDCDIRITDISVSRNHAYIEKVDGDFYVFDSKSKFGTLVRQDILTFQLGKIKQGIQIGRTVFTFQLIKKSTV